MKHLPVAVFLGGSPMLADPVRRDVAYSPISIQEADIEAPFVNPLFIFIPELLTVGERPPCVRSMSTLRSHTIARAGLAAPQRATCNVALRNVLPQRGPRNVLPQRVAAT